jgi:hypothetical protein
VIPRPILSGGRVPSWLKVGFSLFVAAWVPCYWAHYGPQNFLWFCDVANFVLAAALWWESALLFSWQAVSVLLIQVLWSIDFLCRAILGFHPIGGTGYMFDPEHYPLHIRLLSLFHLATPPLLLWALGRFGYDRRALALQTATACVILPISYWAFAPEQNLNWAWGPFDKPQELVAPGLYFAACLVGYPLLLYVPTHLLLMRCCHRPDAGTSRPQR